MSAVLAATLLSSRYETAPKICNAHTTKGGTTMCSLIVLLSLIFGPSPDGAHIIIHNQGTHIQSNATHVQNN
jgi:hypothetical protein